MAAPTTVQTGLNYLLKSDGTTIGGGTDATLRVAQNAIATTNKGSSQWKSSLNGVRTWEMSFEGMYAESAELAGSTVDFTVGGVSVKGITNVTLDVNCELLPTVNSTTGLDRTLLPSTRTLTCTVSGHWYDFDLDAVDTGGDEALENLVDHLMITTGGSVSTAGETCVLTFGGSQSYSFTGRPTTFELGTPFEGVIPYTVTVESTGSVSAPTTTNADGGLAAYIADIFAATATSFTALLTTGTTDYTEFSGTAYPESLSISIDYEGPITVSGTLQGSGAIDKDEAA